VEVDKLCLFKEQRLISNLYVLIADHETTTLSQEHCVRVVTFVPWFPFFGVLFARNLLYAHPRFTHLYIFEHPGNMCTNFNK
jgi:hypothetical protein